MAAVTLLANAVRGSLTTPVFDVPAGQPKFIRLAITSPTFATTPGQTWDLVAEKSLDGGATWAPWFTSTNVGGFGLAAQNVFHDGAACKVRGQITVAAPYTWGVTGEIL